MVFCAGLPWRIPSRTYWARYHEMVNVVAEKDTEMTNLASMTSGDF